MDHLPDAGADRVSDGGHAAVNAGFVLIEHYPVFDAFYMTLTTVTTVVTGKFAR